MLIRDFDDADVEILKRLHRGNFPFPDLTNNLYISKRTITERSKILGAGFIRLTSEAILILDDELPKVTKTKAVLSVGDSLLKDAVIKGLDECHAFVRQANIETLLQRMGFQESKGGKALVLHF